MPPIFLDREIQNTKGLYSCVLFVRREEWIGAFQATNSGPTKPLCFVCVLFARSEGVDGCLPSKHHNNPSSPCSTIIRLPAHTATCLKDEREFVGFLVDMPQDVLYGEIKNKGLYIFVCSSQIPDRPQDVLCRWRDSKKQRT